jgi:hypothetical protein
MGEARCTHGEDEKFLSILVRKPEIKEGPTRGT